MASIVRELEMEAGDPKEIYQDQPKIDLVWLPCGGVSPQQASTPSESSSSNVPQHDGAAPQRQKGSPLFGLSSAADESLLKAQQQFWCQQLRLYDQLQDLKPHYAKLWLKAIRKKEIQIDEQVRLEAEAAAKRKEEEGTGEETEDEDGEEDEDTEEDEDEESEDSDGDVDAHKGTKRHGATPVAEPGQTDATAGLEEQRARRHGDASSGRCSEAPSARDEFFKKLQKILSAKAARRKSSRACKVFFVAPVAGENGTLVLPNFSPSGIFEPTDAEQMHELRDSSQRSPGPDSLQMLKELVAEIKKVEAASESASIYTSDAAMQAHAGQTGLAGGFHRESEPRLTGYGYHS